MTPPPTLSTTSGTPRLSQAVVDRTDRIAVIGAGTSGLAMVKNLRQAAFKVDCLEREADLGGNWNIALPCSRVMASTHLISSKGQTEYLDHPMPDGWPEYPSHRLVLDYLRSYVDRFGLGEHLQFGAGVRRVTPMEGPGAARGGGWLVELESGELRRYGRLVIANGHNWDFAFPAWSGRSGEATFGGAELHSGEYKTPDAIAGKRVLVVGGGNSGCDIVVECSQHAALTRLSLRRGYHFLPKFYRGQPIDAVGERLLRWRLPLALRRLLALGMIYLVQGPRAGTGLPKPDHRLFETHPTINSQLIYQLRHGDLEVRPDVERLTGAGVRYVDGREEPFDTIVYATGYHLSFPFMDSATLNWRDGRPELYLNVFHPERDDLFVLGMIQPDSGQWGLVDRQARLVTQYLLASEQGASAARALRERKRRPDRDGAFHDAAINYVETPRHRLEVEHHRYGKRLDREWRRLCRGVTDKATAATA
ncbi:putative oxidoreductase CzcO [Botrimarina colliarenosi]|uniref:Putative oxidoreductase CzcO n=1 Tax=Botrimarina colliarenosi TaxID=2528001 RepID=A0A5C6ABR3_9BACT|nr:NAD(P)-binding domain-containing protein [Botrimarina colliarenosi]TWT96850.1 putative oxidoreductase CzcO [Botrimarina colliarenosi]